MTTQERREWLLLFVIYNFLIIMNEPSKGQYAYLTLENLRSTWRHVFGRSVMDASLLVW